MTKQEALNSLYVTYIGGHNADKQEINRLFDSALKTFGSVEKAYDAARFGLALMFGEMEKFTIPEVSRLLECSEAECMQMIEKAGIEVIHDDF